MMGELIAIGTFIAYVLYVVLLNNILEKYRPDHVDSTIGILVLVGVILFFLTIFLGVMDYHTRVFKCGIVVDKFITTRKEYHNRKVPNWGTYTITNY